MNESKKTKKRIFVAKIILVIMLVLSVLIGIGILFIYKESKTEVKNKKANMKAAQELKYKYDYKELDNLKFLTTNTEKNLFKSAFETYAVGSFTYSTFTTVTVKEDVVKEETDGIYRFYLALDNMEESIVEGIYKIDTKTYTFGFFENKNLVKDPTVIDEECLPKETVDNSSTSNSNTNLGVPDGTEDLPVVENEVPLVIKQESTISTVLSTEQLEKVHKELLAFLLSQSEFRRQLTVAADTVVTTNDLVSFRLLFDTKRADNKNITVGMKKADSTFTFIIE